MERFITNINTYETSVHNYIKNIIFLTVISVYLERNWFLTVIKCLSRASLVLEIFSILK